MSVRTAFNAGVFYPSDERAIRAAIAHYRHGSRCGAGVPVAIVAPHAGWEHCGTVMATAFGELATLEAGRVVHLGPSHYRSIDGVIASGASAFETPLGRCAVEAVLRPGTIIDVGAHRQEHAHEVQLPFLQSLLGTFDYVPLLVGSGAPEVVADLLETLFDGSRATLFVVSSDLSHHLSPPAAHDHDMATLRQVEALDPTVGIAQACGADALNGLTVFARRHGWRAMALDRNDSAVSGRAPRDPVVGYGAIAFYAD